MISDSSATASSVYQPFVESHPSASVEELRASMNEQGYLFFRSLVPADEVLAVRRDVLELCREAGWLDESRDVMEAVVTPGQQPLTEGRPEYMAIYRRVLKLPRFHDFPLQPALMEITRKLLGGDVLVHPRRIGRITFPNFEVATTPPHQDHFYIRGTVETYSCWVPLGDCPMSLGSLAVWPGSHRRGFIEHTVHHPGAVGGRGVPVDEDQAEWHTSDFEIGDALFFHSFCIHKALPNL
ncbi:MAG: phytanoyl-CoA dioxygenase family protein, partial [Armatimonadota bacterium]|nr:phytanoyl-CoA dioxygenase family protein [Armatimonadota bacterium]